MNCRFGMQTAVADMFLFIYFLFFFMGSGGYVEDVEY